MCFRKVAMGGAKPETGVLLGLDIGGTQIKAAWRKLARTHHPDLTGDDPAASRIATQRMAEINDAYAALTRDGGRLGTRWAGPDVGASDAGPAGHAGRGTATSQRGGPPKPKATPRWACGSANQRCERSFC